MPLRQNPPDSLLGRERSEGTSRPVALNGRNRSRFRSYSHNLTLTTLMIDPTGRA
jgi:hypothetical protein